MKKLNATVLMLFFVIGAMAQKDPKYGLKAGLNVSTLNYSNGANTNWRTGFHIGALAHIHYTPAFSLQPEIYYSSQGAKLPNDVNLNMSYINIPFLLQYNFHNGLRLQGGPQIGFLVGVSDKVNGVVQHGYKTSDFKSVDISIPLGLSYLGYSGFGVDARYNIGLTNVSKTGPVTAKNSVFQVGVFYLFDHNHKTKSAKRK